MKLKPNYFIIPLIVVVIIILGSYFTSAGMPWYKGELNLPSFTPPNWVFPIAWNTIFLCATISVLLVWNTEKQEMKIPGIFNKVKIKDAFWFIIALFSVNAFLNVWWSVLFFQMHLIKVALIEMIILELTIIFMMIFSWGISKAASLLLSPYLVWVGFATYLTYLIQKLNP